MRRIASERAGTGACTLATAMQLWLWTLHRVQTATDADGAKLYHKSRQGVTFPLADALCWLLAARQFILDNVELEAKGAENPALAESLAGTVASSPTFAMCNRRGPPVKRAGFAPRSFTATTGTRPGMKRAATAAIAPRNWRTWKALFPALTARPGRIPTLPNPATPSAQGRSVCQVRRAGSVCPFANQVGWLSHRLSAGQRPRRRGVKVMTREALDYPA